jgi:TolB-like protein
MDPHLPKKRAVSQYVTIAAFLLVAMSLSSALLMVKRAPPPTAATRSVAILPFALSDSNAGHLDDGISDRLIEALSQIPQLRVMPRTATFRYRGAGASPKAIGRDLGVNFVMTGRIAQEADTLVVLADLMDAADGAHVWGQRYTRPIGDPAAVQADIAREIADSLKLLLTRP